MKSNGPTLIGPFLRTPTPNNDKLPILSSKDILVAGSTMAAAAAAAEGTIAAAAIVNNVAMRIGRVIGLFA